jgi:hypothetical protein
MRRLRANYRPVCPWLILHLLGTNGLGRDFTASSRNRYAINRFFGVKRGSATGRARFRTKLR